MPIQEEDVVIFWRKLEIGSDIPEEHHRDMESEMHDLTSLLQEINTGPISNVREVRQLIKDVIHPVLPDDPCHPLKIGKSSGSGSRSGSGSGSGNPNPRGRGRPPCNGRSRDRGCRSVGPVYQPLVVSNFLFGEKNHWVEIRRRMSHDLRHRMHLCEQLFSSVERVSELIMKTNWEEGSAPPEYWMNTPDHFYVIANTFNLCVVFHARSESTTVLPLVSNMDLLLERYSLDS
ncbi:hypothetical protein M9H77_31305 [Catharanthus roseus]|uniref:Uncharacterized protein n=1 Tax=Catharanthus roseus TaxID=4058 RepID=A0ACB9ZZN8_CATRO|nr:hypothetical protein M9H77_31305 [Catharanthus roseus]